VLIAYRKDMKPEDFTVEVNFSSAVAEYSKHNASHWASKDFRRLFAMHLEDRLSILP
jgi:hypothetical protein